MIHSVECSSLRCELPVPLAHIDAALVSSLFVGRSAAVGCYDLTTLGSAVLAYTPLIVVGDDHSSQQQGSSCYYSHSCTMTVNDATKFDLRCFDVVPPGATMITLATRVFVTEPGSSDHDDDDGAEKENNISSVVSIVSEKCPWVSDVSLLTIKTHLVMCKKILSLSPSHPDPIVFSACSSSSSSSSHSGSSVLLMNNSGLVISGPPSCGKRTLARAIATSLPHNNVVEIDCYQIAELAVLHQEDFSPQVVMRNILRRWMTTTTGSTGRWSCLVLHRLDCWDDDDGNSSGVSAAQKQQKGGTTSLGSSLPESSKRILLLELSRAFRSLLTAGADGGGCFWIATASSSSALARKVSPLSRWVAHHIPLPRAPEFSQRLALLSSKWYQEEYVCSSSSSLREQLSSSSLITEEKKRLLRQLAVKTHNWSVARLFDVTALSSRLCRGENDDDVDSSSAADQQTIMMMSKWARLKVYGMDDDLSVIDDACVEPLCRVAKELREGIVSFSLSTTTLATTMTTTMPKGILVVGPSGCGKSHVLKHLAGELTNGSRGGVSVIFQDTLSLVQKEVGATEYNIQQLFDRARASAPCVLLLDHIDSIAAPRTLSASSSDSSSSLVADRMLSTLLVQMDGVEKSDRDKYVLVVATAPSLEALDPAIRRPGRLDIHVHVQRPGARAVAEMIWDRCCSEKLRPASLSSSSAAEAKKIVEETATKLVDVEQYSFADVHGWCSRKVTKLLSDHFLVVGRKKNRDDDDDDHQEAGFDVGDSVVLFQSAGDWLRWLSEL